MRHPKSPVQMRIRPPMMRADQHSPPGTTLRHADHQAAQRHDLVLPVQMEVGPYSFLLTYQLKTSRQ